MFILASVAVLSSDEGGGRKKEGRSYLLGGYSKKRELRAGRLVDGPIEKWASNLEMIKITIRFL
jgi:hypothetical protein